MSDMVVTLSSEMGLGLSEIKRLTLTQIIRFTESLKRKRFEELMMVSNVIRVSAIGDKKAFSRFYKGLESKVKTSLSHRLEIVEPNSEEFDWKEGKKGIIASNRSPEFFKDYFKNQKKKKLSI